MGRLYNSVCFNWSRTVLQKRTMLCFQREINSQSALKAGEVCFANSHSCACRGVCVCIHIQYVEANYTHLAHTKLWFTPNHMQIGDPTHTRAFVSGFFRHLKCPDANEALTEAAHIHSAVGKRRG